MKKSLLTEKEKINKQVSDLRVRLKEIEAELAKIDRNKLKLTCNICGKSKTLKNATILCRRDYCTYSERYEYLGNYFQCECGGVSNIKEELEARITELNLPKVVVPEREFLTKYWPKMVKQ